MSIKELISDQELIEKLQKGDHEAFDQIFKRYSGRMYGFAFKYLKSKEESEGVVQDVFLKIWENKKDLKKESSLKSYLFTVTYHNMCRIFRHRNICLNFIEKSLKDKKPAFNPEEQMEYIEALEQVNRLIEKLPEKQKQIFIESRKNGKSIKEIAKDINLAPRTISNNLSLALKFLKSKVPSEYTALLCFFVLFIQ